MPPVSRSSVAKTHQNCEYCDKEFPTPFSPERHRRVHTGNQPFSCNLCDYSATQNSSLEVHIRSHLKEKPFKFPESKSGCNFSASDSGNVSQHHKVVHLGKKGFECPLSGCLYKSGRKTSLILHMKTLKGNPENAQLKFSCRLCPFKGNGKSSLKIHMIYVHSEEKNPDPDPDFKYLPEGRHHQSKNLALKLVCPYPKCEYKTDNELCLNGHLSIHSLDKKYKCRICDYASHHLSNLTVHIRIHTKERPFKCKIQGCQYQTKQSANLNTHVRAVHEKLRPFKCQFSDSTSGSACPYASSQKSKLKRHQMVQHGIQDASGESEKQE